MSIRRHSVYNLIGSIVPIVVTFVTVPLYLHRIGEARYGVMAIVWLLLGYFGLFDLGLSRATANRIAQLRVSEEGSRERVFWTAVGLNGAFGVVGGTILYGVAGVVLRHFFRMPEDMRAEVLSTLPWLAMMIPLATISGVLIGTLEGMECFGKVNILQVIGSMLFNITPLVVAYIHGPDLRWLIPSAILARGISTFPFWVAVARALPLKTFPGFELSQAKLLLSYGGWVTVNGVLDPLFASFDRFAIGSTLDVSAVALYTVPYQIATRMQIIPAALSRSLFPRFSGQTASEALPLGEKAVAFLAVLTSPIMVLTILLLYPFLSIWVNPAFARGASHSGEILVFATWMSSMAYTPYALLQGQGRPRAVALLHLAEAPFLLLSVWLGVRYAGLQGAACALLLRNTVDSVALFILAGMLRGCAVRLLQACAWIAIALATARFIGEVFIYRIVAAAIVFGLNCAWAFWNEPMCRELVQRFRWRPADTGVA